MSERYCSGIPIEQGFGFTYYIFSLLDHILPIIDYLPTYFLTLAKIFLQFYQWEICITLTFSVAPTYVPRLVNVVKEGNLTSIFIKKIV